jgi:hypothetical protein
MNHLADLKAAIMLSIYTLGLKPFLKGEDLSLLPLCCLLIGLVALLAIRVIVSKCFGLETVECLLRKCNNTFAIESDIFMP